MQEDKEKLWSIPFILLLLAITINTMSGYLINPIFAEYQLSRGVDFVYTGIISSTLSLVSMFCTPFWGSKCDESDLKKLAILAYGGIAVSTFMYSLADSMITIILVRALHGVFFGLSTTLSVTFAVKFVPKSRLAEGVGYIGMGSLIGNLLGPQIGTIISDNLGINNLFRICFALGLLCITFTILVPYKFEKIVKVKKRKQFSDYYAKELTIYMIIVSVFSLGNGIISYYLKSMGNERNIANISLFFTVYALVLMVLKPITGKIQDKVGIKVILYPACIIYTIGVIVLANAYSLIPILIAAVLKAIGQGSGTPAIQAEAIRKMGVEKSGLANSTILIGQNVGNAVGPIFASAVIPTVGYTNMYYIYVGFLVLALIIYFIYNKREDENEIS